MQWIEVLGEPRSKARVARARNGHAYVDKKTADHEKWLGQHMADAVSAPFLGGVGIEAVFYRSSKHRIDVDNLMKAVLDAAKGILWIDDVQVVRLIGTIELDRENPRTLVKVWEHSTSMPRGVESDIVRICPTCASDFTTRAYKSAPAGVYCSRACMQNPPATCEECGEAYRKNSSAQRFCTKVCAARCKATREKIAHARRRASRPLPTCRKCGAGLKRHGAVLCRSCWLERGPGSIGKTTRKADVLSADVRPLVLGSCSEPEEAR